MLLLKDVSKSFGSVTVVKGLTLSFGAGEKCCLVGPIGSGKTTLLRLIAGLEVPDKGEIFINGDLATSGRKLLVPPYERKIGMVFQNLALWPHLNVLSHLLIVMDTQLSRKEKRERALETLDHIGLKRFLKSLPIELSGGQRQKLAIARMMVTFPNIALLDEPFANLDPNSRKEIRGLIFRWIEKSGITCIMVTHYPSDEDLSLFDTFLVMEEGYVITKKYKKTIITAEL